MARHEDTVWYEMGRGLGLLASAVSARSQREGRAPGGESSAFDGDAALGAVASAATALVLSAVRRWMGDRRPSTVLLLRGAAAGAAAAGMMFAIRRGRETAAAVGDRREAADLADQLIDRLLAGAGRGLVYAALLEPVLVGPPIVRGAIAGTADYLALPLGGLFTRLESFSPIKRVPVISALLEAGATSEDEPYLAHLAHGAVLGLLYGRGERS